MSTTTSEYIATENWASTKRGYLYSALERVLNAGQDVIANSQWSTVQSFARSAVFSRLELIQYGQLLIVVKTSKVEETYEFGKPFNLQSDGVSRDLKARVEVKDESFWIRLFLHPDFGFADAYMLGLIDVDSLSNVFRMFILNRKHLNEMSTLVSPVLRVLSYFTNQRFSNSLSGSKGNISVHYDLPEELFTGFLSWDMTYSCAIFDEEAGGHTGDLTSSRPIAPPRLGSWSSPEDRWPGAKSGMDDLERGQMEKLRLIARKARIKTGSKVLEIGCGWGSFAILAAREFGASVDTLTISESQKLATEANILAAGVSHLVRVHLLDYRDMPKEWEASFDAVISIGVTEHIGAEFLDTWFRQISWAMKPENSFKVFTMTTVPDTRWDQFKNEVDFFRKYIHPGAMLGSVKTLVNSITAAGLNIESIDDVSPHYTRTAREWGYRFEKNWESHIKPAFKKHDASLTEEALEIFRRKWRYYFAYCEGGFALRCIYDHLFVTTREHNVLGY